MKTLLACTVAASMLLTKSVLGETVACTKDEDCTSINTADLKYCCGGDPFATETKCVIMKALSETGNGELSAVMEAADKPLWACKSEMALPMVEESKFYYETLKQNAENKMFFAQRTYESTVQDMALLLNETRDYLFDLACYNTDTKMNTCQQKTDSMPFDAKEPISKTKLADADNISVKYHLFFSVGKNHYTNDKVTRRYNVVTKTKSKFNTYGTVERQHMSMTPYNTINSWRITRKVPYDGYMSPFTKINETSYREDINQEIFSLYIGDKVDDIHAIKYGSYDMAAHKGDQMTMATAAESLSLKLDNFKVADTELNFGDEPKMAIIEPSFQNIYLGDPDFKTFSDALKLEFPEINCKPNMCQFKSMKCAATRKKYGGKLMNTISITMAGQNFMIDLKDYFTEVKGILDGRQYTNCKVDILPRWFLSDITNNYITLGQRFLKKYYMVVDMRMKYKAKSMMDARKFMTEQPANVIVQQSQPMVGPTFVHLFKKNPLFQVGQSVYQPQYSEYKEGLKELDLSESVTGVEDYVVPDIIDEDKKTDENGNGDTSKTGEDTKTDDKEMADDELPYWVQGTIIGAVVLVIGVAGFCIFKKKNQGSTNPYSEM